MSEVCAQRDDAPAVLSMARPQPKPIGAIIVRQPEYDQTIVTRNWNAGDAQRCGRCPTCQANPCDTCTIIVPGLLDNKSALAFRFGGDN